MTDFDTRLCACYQEVTLLFALGQGANSEKAWLVKVDKFYFFELSLSCVEIVCRNGKGTTLPNKTLGQLDRDRCQGCWRRDHVRPKLGLLWDIGGAPIPPTMDSNNT